MKQLVWHGLARDVDQYMKAHVETLNACFRLDDHKESLSAFRENRPAKFAGK